MFLSFFKDRSEIILGKTPEMILEILVKSFLVDKNIYPDNRGYLDLTSMTDSLSEYLSSTLGFNLGLIFHGPHLSLIEFHKKYPRDITLGRVITTIKTPYLDPIFIEAHRKSYDQEEFRTKVIPLNTLGGGLNDPKSLLKINIQV